MSEDASVEEEVGQAARVALTVAAQLADKFARAHQELARDAQRKSEQVQRQLQARFEGERDVAGARLMVVERPEWWDRADIAQIAGMHEAAQQWKDFDPRAQAAAETIAREVKDRYGIDIAQPGADPQAVRAALAQVELDRDQAARGERSTGTGGVVEAIAAVQAADRPDARAAESQLDSSAGNEPERTEDRSDLSRGDTADRLSFGASELAQGQRDLTESLLSTSEAERYRNYFTNWLQEMGQDTVQERIDSMLDRAAGKDQDADAGGTATQSPDDLRREAALLREEAAYFRSDPVELAGRSAEVADLTGRAHAERAAGELHYDSAARRIETANELNSHGIAPETIAVRMRADIAQGRPARSVGADQARAAAERGQGQIQYDSAARRVATASELESHGIPQNVIDVRMRADIAQGRPAAEATAHGDRVRVPQTSRGRGAGRNAGRPERSR